MDDTFSKRTELKDFLHSKGVHDFNSNAPIFENGRCDLTNDGHVHENLAGPHSAKILKHVSLLYIAFKRADVSSCGLATIEDIRRSFFEDQVVHSIFGLGNTLLKSEQSHHETVINCPEGFLKLSPIRSNEKNKTGPFKKGTQSPQNKLWECLGTTVVSSFSYLENVLLNGFFLNKWKNNLDLNLFFAKSKIEYFHDCFTENSESRRNWSVESQKKLDKMLMSLRRIEIDGIRCFSHRQNTCVNVGFPEYVSAFFIYVSPTHPTMFKTSTSPQHPSIDKPTRFRRKQTMQFTLSEQFVRDSYLGTCITHYESVLPHHLSLPKTFVMEDLLLGFSPDNKKLFHDALPSTSLSRRSRLSPIEKEKKKYFQHEIEHRKPLTKIERENLTKELQTLQRKIRTSQENRIVRMH
ncbi:uncharacterized protein LOC128884268 isoform X2 [Hylaeus volcanicus]|uniref:uncharacterized protein LOC128884268 isoform X2 n=1 Tax=Hylaeus volcanicus TaxID=313075 RepID=UPI0023B7C9CD|nr:uncharacterized protein LOC128884268 isoform X2 [Hylaeus volcanicus]